MTWAPYGEIGDSTALELGRLTWAAIALEGLTDRICELLCAGSSARGPLSSHVERATKYVGPNQIPSIVHAVDWLHRALAAIESRNEVLHSTTAAFLPAETVADFGVFLVNERHGSRHELSAESFATLRGPLEGLCREWRLVELGLVAR